MTDGIRPQRLALVVHPTRTLDAPLGTLSAWGERNGIELVQLMVEGSATREVAPPGTLEPGDLVVALGGDGTVLSALRAAAATDAPVLGVACGSLGVLTTVVADDFAGDLERLLTGDWTTRAIPALDVRASDGTEDWAVNDFVVFRRGAGQVIAELAMDGELYARVAGDGLVVATPAGSSGYSLAAGGPLLAARARAFVCTPLAMHGGNAPPLVLPADAVLTVEVQPTYVGFDAEIDGHHRVLDARSFEIAFHESKARLVAFAATDKRITRLRQRGLITDSPRVLARDRRDPAAASVGERDA
jgi:NAD+ kinase